MPAGRQIVDGPERGSPEEVLAALRDRRAALREMYAGEPRDDLDCLLRVTVDEYPSLSAPLFEAMLDGMETDAQPDVRYERWDDLERYCYCVAGVVGEMSLPLLRVPDSELAAARAPARTACRTATGLRAWRAPTTSQRWCCTRRC